MIFKEWRIEGPGKVTGKTPTVFAIGKLYISAARYYASQRQGGG